MKVIAGLVLAAVAFSVVAAKPALPESCSWTGTGQAKCEFDSFSKNYSPVAAAAEIASIQQIKDLTFHVNTPPKNGKSITDEDLSAIGQSLNSTSVTALNFILGSLEKITGEGIAKFTAFNAVAQKSLTSLSLDIQLNPVNNTNAAIIGENIGKFSNLNTLSLNVKDLCYFDSIFSKCKPATDANGLAFIASNFKELPKIQSLSLFADLAPFTSAKPAKAIGDGLSSMKALKSLRLEISNSGITDEYFKGILEGVETLTNLEQLYFSLKGNELHDVSFDSIVSLVHSSKKVASLKLDFGSSYLPNYNNNTISVKGLRSFVEDINSAKYQGQLELSLMNAVKSKAVKSYAKALACLINPKLLVGEVSLTQDNIPNPDFVKVITMGAGFDESKCGTGITLTTRTTGGPINDVTHVCVRCGSSKD
jgi:hypothetical protein